jgi:NADPH2:quinone reductase
MKATAARLHEHGEPLVVEELDLPEPGPDEVLVQLAFAGVNPVDRYQMEGRVAADGPRPRTLGGEASGWHDGRPVLLFGHGLGARRDGVWATAAVVPEQALIPLPEGVGLEAAAAMGVAGLTAWRCAMEKARVTGEDRVLVLGASGGVGSVLVSIARAAGATVWGQTGHGEKAQWVRERGASEVVVGGPEEVIQAAQELRPTVVFDALGDGFFGAAVQTMQEKGRLVLYGTSAGPEGQVPLQVVYRKGLTVMGYAGLIESDEARAKWLAEALTALRDGRMEIVIDKVVPLAQVGDALALLTDRSVRGKIVLSLAG